MELPDEIEQDIAEAYVLERKLFRPKTDAKRAVLFCLLMLLIPAAIGGLIYFFLFCSKFAPKLPNALATFKQNSPAGFGVVFFLLFYVATAIVCMRPCAIGAIKMYQHYSPEEIRRRCLFKPTCSEYAILAIKKYGVIIGLIKTYKRLFLRCRGNIYRIDYPYRIKKKK